MRRFPLAGLFYPPYITLKLLLIKHLNSLIGSKYCGFYGAFKSSTCALASLLILSIFDINPFSYLNPCL